MPGTWILVAAVIVAALVGYALGRAHGRDVPRSQGRLTLGTQPITPTTTQLASVPPSMLADIADELESALKAAEPSAGDLIRPGAHMSVKIDLRRTFKFASKELADAVAERERAKGMNVVVTPPDATDEHWRVDSTK